MKSKKMTTALSIALTCVGAGAFAENLVWVGDKQNSWERDDSLANWTNQEGKVRSFQRNDNAYISDLSATEPSLKMGSRPVYVTDVVFDIQDEFALLYEGSGGFRAGVISSFTKRGPGRLTIQRTSGYNDMACDAVIEAGTLELVGPALYDKPLLGNLQSNVAFRVSPGASFVVHEPYHLSRIEAINRSSTPTSGNPPLGGRILLDGGTFVLGQSAVSDGQHTASAVRELALTNGATVRFAGFGDKDNRGNAIFRVADKVSVGGTNVSSIVHEPAVSGLTRNDQRWMLDFEHPTEFEIADVTGDESVDFVFPSIFTRYRMTGAYPWGALLKTGAGTMQFVQPDDSLYSGINYRADIEIREGTLILGGNNPSKDINYNSGTVSATFLGDMTDPDRKIEVTGGTLFITERGMLDKNVTTATFQTPIVFKNGGTLKISEKGTPNTFGPLVFNDGRFEYVGGRENNVGMAGACGTVKITSETKTPTVWPAVSLGYWFLMPNYATEFEVDDVTEDGAVDFDFGLWMTIPYLIGGVDPVTCGFVKKGAGTMRLAANHEYVRASRKVDNVWVYDYLGFLGEARVTAGALQVDGSIASNLVTVASGAFLSGTGTVGRVDFAAGAGFVARLGQAKPLKVLGDFAVPRTGTVELIVPEPSAEGRYKVDFAQIGGTISSAAGLENPFAEWSVTVNGDPANGRVIRKENNVLTCVVGKGLAIIVR